MDSLKLWYNQPAKEWVEALPTANGRLGGMVFGGIKQERIQLNEDTLWMVAGAGRRTTTWIYGEHQLQREGRPNERFGLWRLFGYAGIYGSITNLMGINNS